MQTNPDQFIAGQWVAGNGVALESVNPATGEKLWRGNSADAKQIEQAVSAARSAFIAWMSLSFEARLNYIHAFANEVTKRQEQLAEILSQDTGKPLWESKTEIASIIGKFEFTKQAYLERCKEVAKEIQGATAITRHKPHGVVLVLGPFNFPGHLPNGHIMPALLAGNTVVFKPSELTPFFCMKLMQCWETAGLPAGVINMLQGGSDVGRLLVDHRDIDGVFFTGSSDVGYKIQAAALQHPQRILALEMGGNNPLVVSKPNDIDAAVYNTVQSAFITAGQRCTCARRLIVVKGPIGEKFVQRLIEVTKRIKVGSYTDQPEPFIGSVISNSAAENIVNAYKSRVELGAEVLAPLTRLHADLALLTPGILDVTMFGNQPDEEIFGPLIRLTWVDDFAAAIKEANDTQYGLSAGLLSDDESEYKEFFKHIRAGIVNWNRPITGASGAAPFGGIGKSGNHRPSAFYAADYCSYPVASMEDASLHLPATLSPGIKL